MSASIRDIAQKLKVSPSTVSRALRGTGRISPRVRARIRQAAKKAGYQVNPLFSQAFSLARQPKATRYRETIAFVIEYPMDDCPEYQTVLRAGAEERVRHLSYKLEDFVISGGPAQHRRWSRILRNRGIRGMIIMPRLEHRQPRLFFEWEHFAAVEIGRTLWSPLNLHRVEYAEYSKTLETIHLLKKVGYRRVGMAVEPLQNQHQLGVYYAAYLLTQEKVPIKQRVPVLALDGGWTEKNFCRWMRQYKPEVLIIHRFTEILDWIRKMKLRVPQDVSLFTTDIRDDDPRSTELGLKWSGMRRDYFTTGRRAVEAVANLLENGELGLVGNPICWQIIGRCEPGATLSRSIKDHITVDGFLRVGMPRSGRQAHDPAA